MAGQLKNDTDASASAKFLEVLIELGSTPDCEDVERLLGIPTDDVLGFAEFPLKGLFATPYVAVPRTRMPAHLQAHASRRVPRQVGVPTVVRAGQPCDQLRPREALSPLRHDFEIVRTPHSPGVDMIWCPLQAPSTRPEFLSVGLTCDASPAESCRRIPLRPRRVRRIAERMYARPVNRGAPLQGSKSRRHNLLFGAIGRDQFVVAIAVVDPAVPPRSVHVAEPTVLHHPCIDGLR